MFGDVWLLIWLVIYGQIKGAAKLCYLFDFDNCIEGIFKYDDVEMAVTFHVLSKDLVHMKKICLGFVNNGVGNLCTSK